MCHTQYHFPEKNRDGKFEQGARIIKEQLRKHHEKRQRKDPAEVGCEERRPFAVKLFNRYLKNEDDHAHCHEPRHHQKEHERRKTMMFLRFVSEKRKEPDEGERGAEQRCLREENRHSNQYPREPQLFLREPSRKKNHEIEGADGRAEVGGNGCFDTLAPDDAHGMGTNVISIYAEAAFANRQMIHIKSWRLS